jgi:tRNA (mo5U34)-methyltransferase
MTPDELRAEILRLGPWHYDIEIAPGIRTGAGSVSAGSYAPELGTPTVIHPQQMMEHLATELFPDGKLGGRSVLDCGCNAGGYLFALTSLGAGRCFGFDARQHWINQARFVASQLPSDNIEFATCDLAALPQRNLGRFDVTIFSGLFYHLPDPVAGLRIAADHTNELLIVNTDVGEGSGAALVVNPESIVEVMSGVNGLAWLPTGPGVIQHILRWCGFRHTRLRFDRFEVSTRRRIEILAARDERFFAHYDANYARFHVPTRPPLHRRVAAKLRRAWRA